MTYLDELKIHSFVRAIKKPGANVDLLMDNLIKARSSGRVSLAVMRAIHCML